MGRIADRWLVEVDRQALPPYLVSLEDYGVAASAELGEGFRLLTFPQAVDVAAMTASGLARFAMPVEWVGTEAEAQFRFRDEPARIQALRRHDRFAAARLDRDRPTSVDHDEVLHLAVASGRILGGRISDPESGNAPRSTAKKEHRPSRAGEKLAEALQWLSTRGLDPKAWTHWLELGAFPGGMTTELSRRGHRVTALDVHPPTPAMRELPGVVCHTGTAESFEQSEPVDAILCDVNGSPGRAADAVVRLSHALRPGGLIVHTLKLSAWNAADALARDVRSRFAAAGLQLFAVRHLRQNRQELTLLALKEERTDLGHLRHR